MSSSDDSDSRNSSSSSHRDPKNTLGYPLIIVQHAGPRPSADAEAPEFTSLNLAPLNISNSLTNYHAEGDHGPEAQRTSFEGSGDASLEVRPPTDEVIFERMF